MEEKKGWASWSPVTKILVLLGAALGGFLLALMIAGGYGVYWLYSAGDQADTQLAISPTSNGYLRWVASEDDPGIGETLDRLAEIFAKVEQTQQHQSLPGPLQSLMAYQRRQQKGAFRIFWPRSLTVSFEEDEAGDRFVLAFNPRGMGGFVKGFFRLITSEIMADAELEMRAVEYRDHELAVSTSTSSDLAFALHGSTILAGREQDLRSTIDRIVDETPPRPSPRLAALEKLVAHGSDLYWVSSEWLPGFDAIELGGADTAFGIDVVSAERWQGVLIVRCGDAECARAAAEGVAVALGEVRAELAGDGIELAIDQSDLDPTTIRFDLRAENVATAMEKAILSP